MKRTPMDNTIVVPEDWITRQEYPGSVVVKEEHLDKLAATLLLAGHKRKCGLLGASPRIIHVKYGTTILQKGLKARWYLHLSADIKWGA